MDCDHPRRMMLLLAHLALVPLALSAVGCPAGLMANLLYDGPLVKPLYKGLEGRRVALVCNSETGAFGPSEGPTQLARTVGLLLRRHAKNVEIVPQQDIQAWTDSNRWVDVQEIGRGVSADMVVAIDLTRFSLHDGATLYKGEAEVKVSVYDLTKDGEEVWTTESVPIMYPRNSGVPTTDLTKRQFQQHFVSHVAREVAKSFYAYPATDDFAMDRPYNGH